MKNLVDTHTLIWFIEGDEQLGANARKEIEKSDATNYISIASIWEIAIKVSLGKLELFIPFSQIEAHIYKNGFQILPIEFEDTLEISALPFYHKDPFDRIIIAQSITNNLAILSKDGIFKEYGVTLIW
jgi:PIN domain nuclease of toxin-antitoxin system